MSNALRLTKKSFTWSVVLMTILWSMGVAALVPLAVNAVDCPSLEAGDLFKVEGQSAVYLLNADMERMYFPHASVYKSWYPDYSGVVEIPSTCFDNYPNPDTAPFGVNYRPGSYLVKVVGSPSVYAVLPGNTLAKIASPEVAEALYGANWASMIIDVSDFFWPNFTDTAAELTEIALHDGMLVKKAGGTMTYYVMDGMLYEVSGDLGLLASTVRTVADSLIDEMTMGTPSMTMSQIVADPPQLGESLTPVETADGKLTVALSASTPASKTLSNSTAYNNMLKVNLTAGNDEDVTVNGLTVTKTGLTANTSVSGVSVWHNGMRLGDVVTSISSDNTVVIGFSGSPLVISAGDTETLTIAFNFSSGATSGTVGAEIASASDVDTTSAVSGSFPVTGNTFSLTSGDSSLGDLTVDAQGVGGLSLVNAQTAGNGNVEIGDTKDIGKFQLTQSNGKHDLQLEQVVFYVPGTVKEADLNNFKLRAPDNSVLATTASMKDRYVTMNLATPYTIPAGLTRTLTLSVDIVDGSGNYFAVELQNDYDVLVKDAVLGFYIVPVDSDGGDWSSEVEAASAYFRMKSGTITLTKASDSPSGNISAGATEVVLARYQARGVGEDFEVRKMGLKIATSTAAYLNGNVKIKVDGKVVHTISAGTSANTLMTSDSTQYTLSTRFTLKSGTDSIIEIVGNVPTTATNVWTYRAYIGNFYGKRMSTLDFQDDYPASTANVAGNLLTVQSTALTVVKDTSLGNRTIAPGGNHVIGQYIVKAGQSEDVCLTNVSVKLGSVSGAFNAPTHLQNLQVWVGDAQLGSTISSVATSSNSFSGNLCLSKNEQKTLKLTADALTTASGVASTSLFTVDYLGAATSKSGQETNIVGQNVTFGSANVIVTAVNDSTTISSIRLPGTLQQVGKWKLESQNEAVTLNKIKFSVVDDTFVTDTTAGNFGTFSLYDSADMTTVLATASYVPGTGNGTVQFTGVGLAIPADGTKYLVLKANVNGSGAMNAASINAFVITDDVSTNLEILSGNGSILDRNAIDATAGVNQNDNQFATSSYHLYHNTAPRITNVSLGSTLELSTQAKVFKYTVTNPGDRELRLGTTTIAVSVSGLTGNGATSGTVGTFKLWEANDAGGLGTYLASTTTCDITAAGVSGGCVGSGNAIFGEGNDQNSLFDSLTIPAGGSRTFIMTANTTGMFNGKTAGTVSLSASFNGATGYTAGANTAEDNWADGVLEFYYTPIGASENSTAYSASDSYDVIGDTLSRSL
ncbi:MAG: hypothetical protein ABII02_01795 [Candidatus Magasanikbacteria bacterium]